MNRAEAFFRNVTARGELGHAYLVEAESDEAALQTARLAAQLAQCETGTACGTCRSCRAFLSGNHPDIITLTRVKDQYGVGEVRDQLVEDIQIRPYSFSRKVYILPEAQRMGVPAQNAILKTLEEPPEYGLILLATSNRNALLPTVLSRLVMLNADEEAGEEEEAAEAYKAGQERFLEILGRAEYAGTSEWAALADNLKKDGLPAEEALNIFEKSLRDLYLAKGGANKDFFFPQLAEKTKGRAAYLPDEAIAELWEALAAAKARVKSNGNPSVVLELLGLTTRRILTEYKEN